MTHNQAVCDKLDAMSLSKEDQITIANTDMNSIADLFGRCETASDVHEVCEELRNF